MRDELTLVLELCREPMIAVRDNKIAHFNHAAKKLFSTIADERSIYEYIPDHILEVSINGDFTTSVSTPAGERALSVRTSGDMMILCFHEDDLSPKPRFLSDALFNSLLSSLFNTSLAVGKVSSDPALSTQSKEYISLFNHNHYIILRLIGNLLYASQLADGTMYLNRMPTELNQLCSQLVSTLSQMMPTGAAISFNSCTDELYATVDKGKIERVLLNIIANSYQHTPADGKITVSLEKRDDRAVISVKDNGSGISPEVLKDVFTRYNERISIENLSAVPSPGMGLAISRGIISLHDGALVIDSTEGEGTTVYISIPLTSNSDIFLFSDASGQTPSQDMHLILTEFSSIFDSSKYDSTYLD